MATVLSANRNCFADETLSYGHESSNHRYLLNWADFIFSVPTGTQIVVLWAQQHHTDEHGESHSPTLR